MNQHHLPVPLVRLGNIFPGGQIYAKCEHLQPSGSFKDRGILHLLDHLERFGTCRRLVVPSMGNTALAAARVGPARGFTVTAVVPRSILARKSQLLTESGVRVHTVDGPGTAVLAAAQELARTTDAYYVHPHLDARWTDGYGSLVAEIQAQLPDVASLLVPVGGGGLLMGVSGYCSRNAPELAVIGVEAYNQPTYAVFDHPRVPTVADGLTLDEPHGAVVEQIQNLQMPVDLVKDEEICRGMRDLYRLQGLVVEPSSAITVAAAQNRGDRLPLPACLILTGGNISAEDFHRLIARAGL